MSDGLAARVRHLEDRAEIEELIARYAVAVDDRDFDTLTDMFTNDAIFHNVRGIEQGRWRFHERKVRQLYAMPMAELPRGLAKPLRKRWPGAAPAAADLPPADILTQSSAH